MVLQVRLAAWLDSTLAQTAALDLARELEEAAADSIA